MDDYSNSKSPELLAPAKNLEVALAAVNHGADAVYMGATKFGAREAAGNSLQDVEKAVKYAHKFRTKVYLTLNTILKENELDEARKIAVAAHEMGCDALIVQDMAFLEMDLPPIPLHASTQTHNATPEKVKFLQDVGFQRVVLARELSISQIAQIRAATDVELEGFIHGALCVSYSGQCYLSQMLTGRSANRGACAQPCRSAYNLIDGNNHILLKNKHLLSLKDLNLTEHLQALAQAGVCSFKVEGRLKDIDYVKNVVAHYRSAIDKAFMGQKKPSSGKTYLGFTPNPEKTFSRGFSTYFAANENPKNIASLNTPKSVGEKIGTIKAFDSKSITVKFEDKTLRLSAGDGICFFDANSVLHGTNLNRVEGNKLWLNNMQNVSAGALVFRNFDLAFQKQLDNPHSAKRLIEVKILFEVNPQSVQITVTDEDRVSVSQLFDKQYITANNEAKALATIHEQLSKSGSSIFNVSEIKIKGNKSGFYTISELNSWRRAILEELEQKREDNYIVDNQYIEKNRVPYPNLSFSFKENVLNSLSRQFYERHGVREIASAYELEMPSGETELMRTRYCLLRELGCCKKEKTAKHLHEPLFLENNGRRLRLNFDCKNCEMVVLG